MIKILKIEKEEYQRFWNDKNYHILQSYNWGCIKVSEGWRVERLGVFKEDQLVDILSIQVKKIGVSKFAYIPKIRDFKYWEELKDYSRVELHLDFLVMEFDLPESHKHKFPAFIIPYNDHIQPGQTNIIPLHKLEEEMFAGLKGNYRRNTKKAQGQGVIISIYNSGEDYALDRFYEVLKQIFSNTKMLPRSKEYFWKIWIELSNNNQATIFTAEIKKEICGAYLVVNDNIGAYELYGGVTKLGRDNEAGYLLKWEAIKHFNSLGKDFYDHWGVSKKLQNNTYANDELHNISSFKEGFGGIYKEFFPAHVLLINKQNYKLFKLLKAGGKFLAKLKKMLK